MNVHPPFRAEHIGSFVRPPRLIEAARGYKAGKLDDAGFRAVQDESIRESSPSRSRSACRASPTASSAAAAGRRASSTPWRASPCATARSAFATRSGVLGVAASPYAKAPLRRKHRIVADDYRFLKSVVKRGSPRSRSLRRT